MTRLGIVKIESFDGRDSYVHVGDDHQDYLFAVVGLNDDGHAEILDSAYRSYEEAARAWRAIPTGIPNRHLTGSGTSCYRASRISQEPDRWHS